MEFELVMHNYLGDKIAVAYMLVQVYAKYDHCNVELGRFVGGVEFESGQQTKNCNFGCLF